MGLAPGGGGGQRPKKKFVYLNSPPILGLMWVGGWVRRRSPGCHSAPPRYRQAVAILHSRSFWHCYKHHQRCEGIRGAATSIVRQPSSSYNRTIMVFSGSAKGPFDEPTSLNKERTGRGLDQGSLPIQDNTPVRARCCLTSQTDTKRQLATQTARLIL